MKFSNWFKIQEYIDSGPFPATGDQARRPDLVNGGIGDKQTDIRPNPMKNNPPTSAFPTYGGEPLPGNKKPMKKS